SRQPPQPRRQFCLSASGMAVPTREAGGRQLTATPCVTVLFSGKGSKSPASALKLSVTTPVPQVVSVTSTVATPPTASWPSWHLTLPATTEQLPWLDVAEATSTFLSVLASWWVAEAPGAPDGPLLVMVPVRVTVALLPCLAVALVDSPTDRSDLGS